MDGEHIADDHWIRVGPTVPMSALTGMRPDGDVFDGSVPYVMIEAIMKDASDEVRAQLEVQPDGETSISDLTHRLLLSAIFQTSRRLALEFKGCTIDPDHGHEAEAAGLDS